MLAGTMPWWLLTGECAGETGLAALSALIGAALVLRLRELGGATRR